MATGKTLRLERIADDVLIMDVAREMGVARSTIHAIEHRFVVKPDQAAAYRAAVARLVARRAS